MQSFFKFSPVIFTDLLPFIALYVFCALLLISAAATSLYSPVIRKPKLKPPAPANKSMVFIIVHTSLFCVSNSIVITHPRVYFANFEFPFSVYLIGGKLLRANHLFYGISTAIKMLTYILHRYPLFFFFHKAPPYLSCHYTTRRPKNQQELLLTINN